MTIDKIISKKNKIAITIKSSVLTYIMIGKEKTIKTKKLIQNKSIYSYLFFSSAVSLLKQDLKKTEKTLKICFNKQ